MPRPAGRVFSPVQTERSGRGQTARVRSPHTECMNGSNCDDIRINLVIDDTNGAEEANTDQAPNIDARGHGQWSAWIPRG